MKFGLEKSAKFFFKNGKVCRKQHMGNAVENEMKESDSMKAYTYLGVEENYSIEQKNGKERLKEYVRRLRLILNTAKCKK
jgi:hypothetical protein